MSVKNSQECFHMYSNHRKLNERSLVVYLSYVGETEWGGLSGRWLSRQPSTAPLAQPSQCPGGEAPAEDSGPAKCSYEWPAMVPHGTYTAHT